jgi:hypothetical protein
MIQPSKNILTTTTPLKTAPPLKMGVCSAPMREELKDHEYLELMFSKTESLKDMTDEFCIFTHALLFTHGHWREDPIVTYLTEEAPPHSPFFINLPSAIFKGTIGRWDSKLLVIRKDGWEQFFSFMALVGAIDRGKHVFHKLLAQQLPVPDALALAQNKVWDVCPMVDVTAFGIDGNDRAVYFKPALKPPVDLPEVVISKPDPDTVKLASNIFANASHPYLAIDQELQKWSGHFK